MEICDPPADVEADAGDERERAGYVPIAADAKIIRKRLQADRGNKDKRMDDGSDGRLVQVSNRSGRTGSNVRLLSEAEIRNWARPRRSHRITASL